MKRLFVGVAGVAVLSLWGAMAQAQTVSLTPGHYDVTATMSPGGGSDPRDRCVTTKHLVSPEAVFNYAFMREYTPLPGHKVINFSSQGGKFSYDVDTAVSIIHVEGTASSTEFSVVRNVKSKSGKGMPMSIKLDGKRTGDCRKGE